jgi:hypothetical protein
MSRLQLFEANTAHYTTLQLTTKLATMFSRALAQRALRLAATSAFTTLRTTTLLLRPQTMTPCSPRFASHVHQPSVMGNRHLSSTGPGPSEADARIEEITELYATAYDEFEMAMEETEKQTTYAEGDRAAAREELDRVLEAYKSVVEGEDRELAEEVKRRIGSRVRELEMGVIRMEEAVIEGDH